MMVALFSEDFNSGMWMDDELKTAMDAAVPILTFRLSNVAYGESKVAFLKGTACVDGTDDIEGNFPKLYEEVCNLLGMPIEQALPVDEVLISEQPKSEVASQKEEVVIEKQKASTDGVEKETKTPSHNLFTAVLIGVGLTLAMVLFLEWVLG